MPGYTFHLIPHTHWDREWYLPRSVFQARLISVLDDLLNQLDSNSDSTFLLDGQTVLLEDYLRVRPDQEPRVAGLVRAGRLQIGPWYVLADELIPAGESHIRNLLAGQADCERLGSRSDVLYSPDAFGHPAVWPQLAKEFGIRYGVIWRGLGGATGQERDLYRWRGPDGHEILLYHLPPDGYEIGAALPADRDRLPQAWQRVRTAIVPRAATRQIAVFIGADHHAAHPDLSRLRALLSEAEPENQFRISRLCDFFTMASAEAAGVPVISGELRWSYGYTWTLQGVHGTRAPLKRRHSLAELSLTAAAEPLAALALAIRGHDQRPILQDTWRTLLRSQFHDSISGTTSDTVTRRVEQRVADARAVAGEIARAGLDRVLDNDPDRARSDPAATAPRLVLWNPVPRSRAGVVVADVTWFRQDILVGPPGNRSPRLGSGGRPFHLAGADGPIPLQPLGSVLDQERLEAQRHYPDQDEVDRTRVAFMIPAVGGLSFATLSSRDGAAPLSETGVWVRGNRIGNGLVELSIGRTGALRLRHRPTRQVYTNLLALESSGDAGDTYTYCPPAHDRIRYSTGPVRIRPVAQGPLVGTLEAAWRMAAGRQGSSAGSVGVRLVVSLYAGSPDVRCTLTLDNRGAYHRLRARIPTGLAGISATAGMQFGSIERAPLQAPLRANGRETPVATAPAHRFVAAARRQRGLAVLAPGFFEYQLAPNGDVFVTLLRAVGSLSRSDLPTRPGHAGWPVPTPLAQCPGEDQLQLAIAPVADADLRDTAGMNQRWEDLFLPLRGIWLRQATALAPEPLDISLQGPGLVFSALKPAVTGRAVVLRCYNARGEATAGAWQFSVPVRAAQRARADERPLHDIRLGEGSRVIPFHAAPHEIVTIMVTLGSTD